jgi:hypothetical protein
MVSYRVGDMIIHALPRRPVQGVGGNGQTDAAVVTPQIPVGADAWRDGNEWRPLSEIPPAWMPFLNRERGGPMDPRKLDKATQDLVALVEKESQARKLKPASPAKPKR